MFDWFNWETLGSHRPQNDWLAHKAAVKPRHMRPQICVFTMCTPVYLHLATCIHLVAFYSHIWIAEGKEMSQGSKKVSCFIGNKDFNYYCFPVNIASFSHVPSELTEKWMHTWVDAQPLGTRGTRSYLCTTRSTMTKRSVWDTVRYGLIAPEFSVLANGCRTPKTFVHLALNMLFVCP